MRALPPQVHSRPASRYRFESTNTDMPGLFGTVAISPGGRSRPASSRIAMSACNSCSMMIAPQPQTNSAPAIAAYVTRRAGFQVIGIPSLELHVGDLAGVVTRYLSIRDPCAGRRRCLGILQEDRKPHHELAAATRTIALRRDRTPMHLDQLLHQGEADPQAAVCTIRRAIDLREHIEDLEQHIRR